MNGQKKKEATQKTALRSARRKEEEPEEILEVQNLFGMMALPPNIKHAATSGYLFTRHRNPDGSVGPFVSQNSKLGDKVWGSHHSVITDSMVRSDTVIEADCLINGSQIGFSSKIGKGSIVYNVSMGDRSRIGTKNRLGGTHKDGFSVTIGDDMTTRSLVEMENVNIGNGVKIGKEAILRGTDGVRILIENEATIGSRAQLEGGVTVRERSFVHSRQKVPRGVIIDTKTASFDEEVARFPQKKTQDEKLGIGETKRTE